MCGFAVLVHDRPHLSPDPDPQVAVALARRGPDVTAQYTSDRLVAVSSRLTHWEEGASSQPYVDEDGGAAVFNGEIYNLQDLLDLIARPDASEIQAVYLAVRDHGLEALHLIDGQFAAVVALPDGRTIAVRDRFGIAPLYYGRGASGWVFASNLDAWSALARTDTAPSQPEQELDPAGLASILTEWAPVADLTPLRGVQQCQAGEFLVIEDGSLTTRSLWWSPALLESAASSDAADARPPTPDELADLLGRLRASVRIRLRSTTPVTCLLSGGVDSTLLGALARDGGARGGLGLYLEGDEVVRDRQRQVAETVEMDLQQHQLDAVAAVTLLEEYVQTRKMPLVRLGPVGMMSLARFARSQGIRSVISGEGADELFGGYDSARIMAARAGALGPVSSLPWSDFGPPEFGAERGPRWARAYWRTIIALSAHTGARRSDVISPVADLISPQLWQQVERLRDSAPTPVTVQERRRHDLSGLLASYLLTVQGDHAWSEEGVELRPAYLATPVVEWALSRDPVSFVSVAEGKTPLRDLIRTLAQQRPGLTELGFAKAAFRVDASFLLQDERAGRRLRELASRAPQTYVQTEAVVDRIDTCLAARNCSEAESMLFLFTASLGVLAAPTS
ncbi:asparagine synthetase B family protein [Gephyromycinifex aptenodytis]|uniref:asparagine synthetase B family protein n=1 Tax=Gephyromycinifex aptenodytis TaxID=2716227 RepID=UPI001446B66C|nr:asparagine synthetase B family protein [Gephyromycinifex aptenodytis]